MLQHVLYCIQGFGVHPLSHGSGRRRGRGGGHFSRVLSENKNQYNVAMIEQTQCSP